jgi:hypothetical protein
VKAQASGDLTYFTTQVAILTVGSLAVSIHTLEDAEILAIFNILLVSAPLLAFSCPKAQAAQARRAERETLQSLRKSLSCLADRTNPTLP